MDKVLMTCLVDHPYLTDLSSKLSYGIYIGFAHENAKAVSVPSLERIIIPAMTQKLAKHYNVQGDADYLDQGNTFPFMIVTTKDNRPMTDWDKNAIAKVVRKQLDNINATRNSHTLFNSPQAKSSSLPEAQVTHSYQLRNRKK